MKSCKRVAADYATPFGALISFALIVVPAVVSAQDGPNPNFDGMWIESATAYTDPRWRLEDLVCYSCTPAAFEFLPTLMEQNEDLPLREIMFALRDFDRQYIHELLTEEGRERFDEVEVSPDPGCRPIGLIQLIRSRLAVKFEQFEDRITLEYEYLGPTRTVYMDGRDHPSNLKPSLHGHSIGWYDGSTLVVESAGLEPNVVRSSGVFDPVRISEDALVIERYTRNEGDTWYDLEVTLVDPRMYRQPFVILTQRRLLESDQVFEIYGCEVVSGQP